MILGDILNKKIYKVARSIGLNRKDVDSITSNEGIYKAGTWYGTVSAKDIYKAGTSYGTVSPKDF